MGEIPDIEVTLDVLTTLNDHIIDFVLRMEPNAEPLSCGVSTSEESQQAVKDMNEDFRQLRTRATELTAELGSFVKKKRFLGSESTLSSKNKRAIDMVNFEFFKNKLEETLKAKGAKIKIKPTGEPAETKYDALRAYEDWFGNEYEGSNELAQQTKFRCLLRAAFREFHFPGE